MKPPSGGAIAEFITWAVIFTIIVWVTNLHPHYAW